MKYKLYIFDLDGTFYDIEDLIAFNFEQEVAFLKTKLKISESEAEKMLVENHIYPEVKKDAKSCTEFFQKIGLDLNEWNRVRSTDFPVQLISRNTALNTETIEGYRQKGIVTLVSNNTLENIRKILNYLNIDPGLFAMIISKEDQTGSNKTDAYKRILAKYSIDASDALAIGDRYNIDVRPLIDLGGSGIVVQGPRGVKDHLKNRDNNSTFTVYRP